MEAAMAGKITERLRQANRDLFYIKPRSANACVEAANEIERLRAIVRVNGLRWGHTHAEIDELLNQQLTRS